MNLITSILIPLSGTFFGAWLAFYFQNKHVKEIQKEGNKLSINKALFQLWQQINTLTTFENQIFKGTREKVEKRNRSAWHHIAAFQSTPHLRPIDLNSLVFLTEHSKGNIIADILVEEQLFNAIILSVDYYRTTHDKELQPKIEQYQEKFGTITSENLEDAEKFFGERIVNALSNKAQELLELTPSAIASNKKVFNDLRSIAKELYPGEKFPAIDNTDEVKED